MTTFAGAVRRVLIYTLAFSGYDVLILHRPAAKAIFLWALTFILAIGLVQLGVWWQKSERKTHEPNN